MERLLHCFMYKYKSLKAGQLPQEHLSFLQNLLNFIITKYLKKEFDDYISIGVNEHSPCGLSATRDIKIYQCHCQWHYYPQWRRTLLIFIIELLLLPKFDNSRSRQRDLSCDYELMTLLLPKEEYPIEPFQ